MKLCKPFYSKHKWVRYGSLVEQMFTRGFMAWQKCSKCKDIKFDWADSLTPAEPDIEEKKLRLKKFMESK